MNKKRQAIFDKSGGKCWYCGCDLNGLRWHEDHVKAVHRYKGGFDKPENENENNKVPACIPCNLFKSTFSIEEFRHEIEMQIERARKSSINFRTSERFGLIKETKEPVVFWFERNTEQGEF